jgi:hypothetical protein
MNSDFYKEQFGVTYSRTDYYIVYFEEIDLYGPEYVIIDVSDGYKAESITIDGFEEYDFFIHHLYYPKLCEYKDRAWVISEGYSGASLTAEWQKTFNKDNLIKKLRKKLRKAGKPLLNHQIKQAMLKSGKTTPRYNR